MSNIWVTSDTHFMHVQPFLYNPRGFDYIDEHDENIIANWNKIVGENDIVIHLGDIFMDKDHEKGVRLINRLKGNIVLIRGNHDTDTKIQTITENCPRVEVIGYSAPFKYRGYNFYLSHYPALVSNYDADKPLKIRTICLAGHCHTQNRWQDFDKGLIYHCELDAHDNKPKLLDEIIEEIKEKIKE